MMKHRRHAFTLVELLFAIAVLSIGLTGIAASLYVGVGQTKATLNDSHAAEVARQAAATLGQVMSVANTPETGLAFEPIFNPDAKPEAQSLLTSVRGNQIARDGAYAWVPLYRRQDKSLFAELLIVVVRPESRSRFDSDDVESYDADPATRPPTLVPAKGTIEIDNNEAVIRSPGGTDRLAPGAAVLLTSMSDSRLTGRVLRLSERVGDDKWSLTPGDDLAGQTEAAGGNAFLVGRGYADPRFPAKGYAGASQVVAVYSTIVHLNR